MSHDPVFDSAQNQALLVVCARKSIRNAAVLGIVWGGINLVMGFFAMQITALSAGIFILGLLTFGAGIIALKKPSLLFARPSGNERALTLLECRDHDFQCPCRLR